MKKAITKSFLFIFLLLIIKCTDSNKKETNETSAPKEEKKEDKNEEEDAEEETGFSMSEKTFDEKLKKVLEEKNLKPNKKITKEQLRVIFDIIYKRETEIDPDSGIEEESGLTPQQQNKQFMDSIFNEVAKGLDYDDKIKVKDIKGWINPERTQAAYAELLQGLAESMGYL